MTNTVITSVATLIETVLRDWSSWETSTFPWFRGEPSDVDISLLPKLFRENGRGSHNENRLLQHFRMKAPTLGLDYVPPREYTDQWLFLAQHVRLPTRLLDWTEGLLIALHFALHTEEKGAVVWMLDPIELNRETDPNADENVFALTWFSQLRRQLTAQDMLTIQGLIKTRGEGVITGLNENLGNINIHKAWTTNTQGTDYPYALHPTNVHPRMSSQISRFTIHGEDERGLREMRLGPRILRKYVVGLRSIASMIDELRMMGLLIHPCFPSLMGCLTNWRRSTRRRG